MKCSIYRLSRGEWGWEIILTDIEGAQIIFSCTRFYRIEKEARNELREKLSELASEILSLFPED